MNGGINRMSYAEGSLVSPAWFQWKKAAMAVTPWTLHEEPNR